VNSPVETVLITPPGPVSWQGYTRCCAICGAYAASVSSFFEGPTFEVCEGCLHKGKLPAGATEKSRGWFYWSESRPRQLSLGI
jgi:hypothetical protein